MILTEADAVHPLAGAGGGTQLWREEVIPAFRQISSAINQHGARFVAQMNHPGHSTYGGNRPTVVGLRDRQPIRCEFRHAP